MGFASSASALRTRFASPTVGFPFYRPTVPILYENERPFEPEIGRNPTWVWWKLREGDSRQVGMGTGAFGAGRRFRTLGLIAVSIFVPPGTGESLVRSIADDVAAIYRAVEVSGVVCRAPRFAAVGFEPSDVWYQGVVITPFFVDLTI